MSLPTISSLCRTLGKDLAPMADVTAPDTEVTAVHISELADPTAYVSGGELLLTTGMKLPTTKTGCAKYVARLTDIGIAALGLGLGPVHDEVPPVLVRACREGGLTLLTVPDETPFLTVTKAYWSARARASEQHLQDAVAAHRSLTNATVAPDPGAEILRRLARALDGWAAYLTPAGEVDQIHPSGLIDEAAALQAEIGRLAVGGAHSAASFVANGRYVSVSPLSVESRIVGYLAVGTEQQLTPAERHVIMTAVALLSVGALHQERDVSAREAAARCVATLVDLGHAGAARELAVAEKLPPLGNEARVLVVSGARGAEIGRVVDAWSPDVPGVAVSDTEWWFLLPSQHPPLGRLRERLTGADESAAALASERVRLDDVAAVRARITDQLRVLSPGEVQLSDVPPGGTEQVIAARVEALLAEQAEPVVRALIAYLRCRGQWERAARELGIHRNTLRYRVERAAAAMELDLDDPDHAARIWLILRSKGVA